MYIHTYAYTLGTFSRTIINYLISFCTHRERQRVYVYKQVGSRDKDYDVKNSYRAFYILYRAACKKPHSHFCGAAKHKHSAVYLGDSTYSANTLRATALGAFYELISLRTQPDRILTVVGFYEKPYIIRAHDQKLRESRPTSG